MIPPNYHSLSFSTKTLMFEQTLDNPPHVEIFLPRKHIPKKSHTVLPPCLFMWLRCKYGNIRHPLGNLSTLGQNRHHHNHNPAGKEYMWLCWKKQPMPLLSHVKGHFLCVKLYQRLFFVPSSLGMSNLYISCPINFRQYSRPFLSYFTLKTPLQQLWRLN